MHCHICDADSDTVVFERGEFSPCADCQAVIYDTLQSYPNPTGGPDDVIYTEVLDEEFDDEPPFTIQD